MGKQQSKQLKPTQDVQRDSTGKLVKGTPNPGGLTKEQWAARQALNLWLCDTPQLETGKAAYLSLLRGDDGNGPNPTIVKDFMDRVAGKVKEQVELSGDDSRPLASVTTEAILAALMGGKRE